jgi:L-lactate dehydrogenase (cytochrome)
MKSEAIVISSNSSICILTSGALERGCSIWVNHAQTVSRCSVTSTIRALPKVVDAVQGKVPVFMDGGIRSGLDGLKALALGAKACFMGRAWAHALGAAGESGVRDMLDILREELRAGMILTGCSDVNRATLDLLL